MTPILDILSSGQELGNMTVSAILGVAVVALAVVVGVLYRDNRKLNEEARNDAKEVTARLTDVSNALREFREHLTHREQDIKETVNIGVQRVLDRINLP